MMLKFATHTTSVKSELTSSDGSTTKLLIALHDGHMVESVIMRHESGRNTLCVSSQVGCAMGCTFCATGTMGIIGSLSTGEILEQLVHAGRRAKIRNIVFMGMGEPLNNYDNVKEAVLGMLDTKRWSLGHGHVTVSTVGVEKGIRKLTRDVPHVNLALSLHAPNQELREKIVPAARSCKIEALIAALDSHTGEGNDENNNANNTKKKTKKKKKVRKAMIQYTMLNGPTSTLTCAHELGALCEGKNIVINLIPYNPTDVEDKYSCPSMEHIITFQKVVMSYGLFVFIRKTMGDDIAGACGQLVLEKTKKENGDGGGCDIEEILVNTEGAKRGRNNVDVKVRRRKGRNDKEDAVIVGGGAWSSAWVQLRNLAISPPLYVLDGIVVGGTVVGVGLIIGAAAVTISGGRRGTRAFR